MNDQKIGLTNIFFWIINIVMNPNEHQLHSVLHREVIWFEFYRYMKKNTTSIILEIDNP